MTQLAIADAPAGGQPPMPAKDSRSGVSEPVLRLTPGFSGLKFSLTGPWMPESASGDVLR